MRKSSKAITWTALLYSALFLLSVGACGESREGYRDDMSETICNRYDECGRIGPDEDYATYEDCYIDMTDNVNEAWPENRCGGGKINEAKFDACLADAGSLSCSNLGFDLIALFVSCRAGEVCVDPE